MTHGRVVSALVGLAAAAGILQFVGTSVCRLHAMEVITFQYWQACVETAPPPPVEEPPTEMVEVPTSSAPPPVEEPPTEMVEVPTSSAPPLVEQPPTEILEVPPSSAPSRVEEPVTVVAEVLPSLASAPSEGLPARKSTLHPSQIFSFRAGEIVDADGDIWLKSPKQRYAKKWLVATGGGILDMGVEDLTKDIPQRLVKDLPRKKIFGIDWNASRAAELVKGHTYAVLSTDEAHYAKVKVTDYVWASGDAARVTFDWVYQPDGSTIFRK